MFRRCLLGLALLAPLWVTWALAQAPPPVPALPDTERRTAYTLTASTCNCAVNFALYGDGTDIDNWLQVWVNGVMKLSTDPTDGWSLSSPTGPIGSIALPITDAVLTFNNPITATVQLVGARRPRQTSQFNENQGVSARSLNQRLTDITAIERELWDKTNDVTGRALLTQPGHTMGPLPPPASCAGNVLAFDSTGLNPICVGSGGGGGGGGGGGSGTVNTGKQNQAAYYALNGTVVSGTNQLPIQVGTNGMISTATYGAIGDGSGKQLSAVYPNLAAAQAVYPFVSDLTQTIDWAATQQAINVSFANGNLATYCPAVTSTGASYVLSNPIQEMNPATSNTGPAWVAGTTYASGAQVVYNGLTWTSAGSGNKGNPPTAVNGYPASLAFQFGANSGLPFANVTVTSASPAVVTLTGHGLSAGQPLVFLQQTYSNINIPSPALPTGINANQVYYVISAGLTSNTFEISATPGGTAINTTSTGSGAITVTSQAWNWTGVGSSDFSSRVSFVGDPGRGSGGNFNGCMFTYNGFTSTAFVVGAYNGNLLRTFRIAGPGWSGNPYRCQMPSSSVGIGNIADGAGTHNTTYDQLSVGGFSSDWNSDVGGGGTLGDSNTFFAGDYSGACNGLGVLSYQNFINAAFGVTVNETTNAATSFGVGAGLIIHGGNYSTFSNATNQFTLSGVTVSSSGSCVNTFCIQATVTNPDSYLNWPLCSYNLQCVYTRFQIWTPNFGNIPFDLQGYAPTSPTSGVINLVVDQEWMKLWNNTCCAGMATDLAAVTTVYAAEAVTTFNGSAIEARGVHVENGVPTTLLNAEYRFGSDIIDSLSTVDINNPVTLADYVCCLNSGGSLTSLINFLAQDQLDYIASSDVDAIIDGVTSNGGNINPSGDRVLIGSSGGAAVGNMDFRHAIKSQWLIHARTNDGEFSQTFSLSNIGATQGFGAGLYDNPSPLQSQYGQSPNGAFVPAFTAVEAQPDAWRSQGVGASPYWGVRPAAYANPCITSGQLATLNSLPAITYTSQLAFALVNNGGSGYQQGDVLTVVGGTGTAAQITVDGVSSGSIYQSHVSTAGSYTVEPTAPLSVTGGHGTGATFGIAWTPSLPPTSLGHNLVWHVLYSTGYPFLFGGTTYRICGYNGTSQTKYAVQQNGLGFSYFQNLTTTNVPHLQWQGSTGSPIIWMNPEALELMLPGLVMTLTPTGGGSGCTSNPLTAIVTEVHPTLGYVMVVNAGANGTPYLPQWSGTCTGTIIGQAPVNYVTPFQGSQTNTNIAAPTAANSTSAFTMQGLAGTITPSSTGNIKVTISGTVTTTATAAGTGLKYQISYGTGAAPTSNATLTGTQVGTTQQYLNPTTVTAADVQVPFSQSVVITGLTPGTPYWLDLAAEAVATASATPLTNVNISAVEN